MAKIEVAYDTHIPVLLRALEGGGALLVANDGDGRPNAMTIGWAQVGIIWGRKIMSVMVRPSRYTYRCMAAGGDFAVCVPYPAQADSVLFCGTESGRDHDKFAECGFTPEPAAGLKSPGIAECGVCWHCQIVNHADFVPERIMPEICKQCYSSGDYHRIYFGQILKVVADEDVVERMEQR